MRSQTSVASLRVAASLRPQRGSCSFRPGPSGAPTGISRWALSRRYFDIPLFEDRSVGGMGEPPGRLRICQPSTTEITGHHEGAWKQVVSCLATCSKLAPLRNPFLVATWSYDSLFCSCANAPPPLAPEAFPCPLIRASAVLDDWALGISISAGFPFFAVKRPQSVDCSHQPVDFDPPALG